MHDICIRFYQILFLNQNATKTSPKSHQIQVKPFKFIIFRLCKAVYSSKTPINSEKNSNKMQSRQIEQSILRLESPGPVPKCYVNGKNVLKVAFCLRKTENLINLKKKSLKTLKKLENCSNVISSEFLTQPPPNLLETQRLSYVPERIKRIKWTSFYLHLFCI